MAETLSAIFQRTHGAPIEIDGRIILPSFKFKLESGRKELTVRRLKSSSAPVSGLRIKAVKGEIEVNGQVHPEIILWSDTSPEIVSLIVKSRSGCELRMWNVWRYEGGVQAWIGNAGIVINKLGDSVRLECSGGSEGVDFLALIVEIDQNDNIVAS